jgi:hypothetical protein
MAIIKEGLRTMDTTLTSMLPQIAKNCDLLLKKLQKFEEGITEVRAVHE